MSIGVGLLIVALIQHCLAVETIEHENYVLLSVSKLNRYVVAAISLLGVVGVWTRLKTIAYQSGQTVYQIKHGLLSNYLMAQLKRPAIAMVLA